MTVDDRTKLQERFARIRERAIARIHQNRPELRGKTQEETIKILKGEEFLKRAARKERQPHRDDQSP
jgi:hypothetical protein